MVTLVDETFVKLKVKRASLAPAITFVAFVSESQMKFVLESNPRLACLGLIEKRKTVGDVALTIVCVYWLTAADR